jgi:hypothetical protein
MNTNSTRGLTVAVVFLVATLLFFGMSFSFAFAAEDSDAPIVGTPSITESNALSIANKAYTGNGVFTDIELEMERDVLVFAIEYTEKDGNEVDVKVNAKTGTVILVESDADEAEDDDEGDAEEDDGSEQIANMRTLINLLTQLVALLRQQGA